MNINEVIEENIKTEKEFYAHINLFKLLLTTELSGKNFDYFCLMGGFQRLRTLENDVNNENISLYRDDQKKELFEFYVKMYDLKQGLSVITHSKSTILNDALKEFNMVTKYYEGEYTKARLVTTNTHITELDIITWLKQNIPTELVCKIEELDIENKEVVKKIGERK